MSHNISQRLTSPEFLTALNTALLIIYKIWDKVEKKHMKQMVVNADAKAQIAAEASIKTAEIVTPNDREHEIFIEDMRQRLFSVMGNTYDHRQKDKKGNTGLSNGY